MTPPNSSESSDNGEAQLIPHRPSKYVDFNDFSCQIPNWLMPAVHAATGQLSVEEIGLLQHYRDHAWPNHTIRKDEIIRQIHQERVPQLGLTQPFLLTALLSLAAAHRNSLQPSKYYADKSLMYRQRAFHAYTKQLQTITADNYESIVLTSLFMLAMTPHPGPDASDEAYFGWVFGVLKLNEGIRILAGLRWDHGIEKFSIFPLVSRELRKLPPPPVIVGLQTRAGRIGATPEHPNPPSTYCMPKTVAAASAVFLPPALMALLEDIEHPPDTGLMDIHGPRLYPIFHVLSPVFVSLYYYHFDPDFNVRCFVVSSFMMPEFLALVKAREPRALVLVAWWFALVCLVPNGWQMFARVRVVKSLSRMAQQSGDAKVIAALEGPNRLVDVLMEHGAEKAAMSIFEGWEGVDWEDGPRKAEEWERGCLVDLSEELDFDGLDLDLSLDLQG